MTTVRIEFGAMAPRLSEQIDVGSIADKRGIAHCQKDADALTRLAVRRLLPESAIRDGRKALLKRITQCLTLGAREVQR